MKEQTKQTERASSYTEGGRIYQKERTRQALLQAAREMLDEGKSPTVALAAQRAHISEATAYRYYADAQSLLRDSLAVKWPDLEALLAKIRETDDIATRALLAGEAMARHVLANEQHIRALIVMANSGAADPVARPGFRFRLIEAVLEPLAGCCDAGELRRLELALAMVISAEACLTLKEVCKIDDEQIVATCGWTAAHLVAGYLQSPLTVPG